MIDVATSRPAPSTVDRLGWWRSDGSEPVRRNLGLVGVLALLLIVGMVTRSDIFLNGHRLWSNELTVLTQASSIGVITIGMTFVMISGGMDLSGGAPVAPAGVCATTLATHRDGRRALWRA